MEFDFVDHQLITRTTDGDTRTIALRPQPVAGFYSQVMTQLAEMSLPVKIWPVSVEMPTALRLDQDLITTRMTLLPSPAFGACYGRARGCSPRHGAASWERQARFISSGAVSTSR